MATAEAVRGARGYLPRAALDRIEAGHLGWLAELRRVSIVFAEIVGLDAMADADALHQLLCALRDAVYRHEGSLRQFIADDKGTVIIAAFGLPPLAHEDEPARAVEAGMALVRAARGRGAQVAAGVTTATVFCGPVGNERRREYAVVGDGVNLAARLMKAAVAWGVLCDEPTARLAAGRLALEALPPITVKGKAAPGCAACSSRSPPAEAGSSPSWRERPAPANTATGGGRAAVRPRRRSPGGAAALGMGTLLGRGRAGASP